MMSAGARSGLVSIGSSCLKIVSMYAISTRETFSGRSGAWSGVKLLSSKSLCRAMGSDRSACISLRSRDINSSGGIRLMSTKRSAAKKQYSKICREDTCNTMAAYGWEGGAKEFCSKHKEEGMESRVSKLCEHHVKCIRFATYGLPGGVRTHCRLHKHAGMLNLRFKLCENPACRKHATFGLIGGRPTHCKEHKHTEMGDVTNKRCMEPGCRKHRVYGFADEKGLYCKIHMKPGMLNCTSKRCEEPGCGVFASFGYAEDRRRRFCVSHKLEDMILLTRSRRKVI